MTRTDVEAELSQFTSGFKRTYRYIQEFIPDHFITVMKISKVQSDGSSIEEFELVKEDCTTIIENFDKELFIKLLIKEELKSREDIKWFIKARDLRTDGCDMGCWATQNPTLHSPLCKKSYKWGAGNE